MSLYTSRSDYFATLAQKDPVLQHGINGNIGYFSSADDSTVIATISNGAHMGLCFAWYYGFRLSSRDNDGAINLYVSHSLRFYCKIQLDNYPDKEAATKAAYDKAYILSEHWHWRLIADGYDDTFAADIPNSDAAISVSRLPLFADNFVGFLLIVNEEVYSQQFAQKETGYWIE